MQIVIDIDDMAHDWLVNGFPDEDDMEMALRAIKNGTPLPTGHWKLDESDNSITCDKCECNIYANDILNGEPHFCPNCGCRMIEPQERSE